MKPLVSKASSWIFNSANSCGAILYGRLEIGVVPGIKSTMNSTHLSGGMSDSSSGKTSGKSRTTGISSRSGRGSTFKECTWVFELGEVYLIVWPDGWVSFTDLALQSRTAFCLDYQSIPRITSMSEDLRAISDARNTKPSIATSLSSLTMVVCHLDPGDCTTKGVDNIDKEMSWDSAKSWDINE